MAVSWRRLARWIVWAGVPSAVAVVAYRNHATLARAVALMRDARLEWLLPGVAAIALVYLCRGFVYGLPLTLLDYSFPRTFLWQTALMATSLHQLVPAGGASGYAFLTYALHQRGVPPGEASLVALIDTLSYAASLATLVVGSLVYLLAAGLVGSRSLVLALAPGLAIVALAAAAYVVQRDKSRCLRVVLAVERRVASLFGARWPEAPVRHFLDDYFRGKAILARKPSVFAAMMGFQYVAVCCDAAALYSAFLALGVLPRIWVVFMGFVMAMAGGAVASVPGGGGSFELIMAAFFSQHGLDPGQGTAAAILYRVIAFWLPVTTTLLLLLRLRRRRKEIRKRRKVAR
jgi:uncharacterized protein (TIRG00374 family)